MTVQQVKFKVAMDTEAKKAGKVKEVVLNVDFTGVPDSLIREHAMANMIVRWQGQVRQHWDTFVKDGVPEKITFGVPLYSAPRGGGKVVTMEHAKEYVNGLSPVDKLKLAINAIQSVGGDTEALELELEMMKDELGLAE